MLDLTQLLVVDRIPNWQSPVGPYHPILDQAREDPYLREFRKWVVSAGSETDAAEVEEVKAEIEAALDEAKRRLLLRYLDEHRLFNTAGKTIVAAAGDLAVPFVGTAATFVQNVKEARSAKKLRWQGFLVNLELNGIDADRHGR